MYRFEQPIFFYLLILVPVAWILYFMYLWWQKKQQAKFADLHLLAKLVPEKSLFKPLLKMVLWSLALVLIIIGLVNPKIGTELKSVKRSGVDIVFALDVSRSMLAQDIAPSRLEKAKFYVNNIIGLLGSDRVGIIIYAGSAYPLLPITTDHAAAKMFLETAHPDMLSSQGTAIGEALKLAENFHDADDETHKYLFILSDGEDHEEETENIIKEIKNKGINTYTIGLGTAKGAPIPMEGVTGVTYKKDSEGNMVITKLNREMLENIAQAGNGAYFEGNNTKETLDKIKKILQNADKKEFETKEFLDYKDQFQWFIGLGLLLLVLEVFLLEKKTVWIQKLNLFNEKHK